jgi:hypothetical protein
MVGEMKRQLLIIGTKQIFITCGEIKIKLSFFPFFFLVIHLNNIKTLIW